MTTELLTTGAVSPPSPILAFDRPQLRTAASYEHELTAFLLQQALAREAGLLREKEELLHKLSAWHDAAIGHLAGLSPRQRQVLDLVLAGHPSKNIAWILGVSQRTVENHRAMIMKKTGSHCLPALVRLALAADWNDTSGPEPPAELQSMQEGDDKRNPASRLDPPCPGVVIKSVPPDNDEITFKNLLRQTSGTAHQS